MAGAGIAGGALYGASDKAGAFPASNRVQPSDLSATIFHLLGIDHHGSFVDRTDRPHRVAEGEPIQGVLR